MAQPDDSGGEGARVYELATRRPTPPTEVHFEVALDDDEPTAVPAPVPVDQAPAVSRPPIVPTVLRSRAGVQAAGRRVLADVGYHAGRQGWLTLTRYSWMVPGYALLGVFKGIGRAVWWAWNADGAHHLTQQLAGKGDSQEWAKVEKRLNAKRMWRVYLLAGAAVAALIAVLVLLFAAPWWAPYLALALVTPGLAWVGRPADKPIIPRAMVTQRYRKLRADIVLRAYYAAGLGRPDKPDQVIEFASTMQRDNTDMGSQVEVLMPYATSFAEVMAKRDKIASGLDVSVQQVYLSRSHVSERQHTLYVAHTNPLAIPAGRSPLLRCKPTDIWKPAPFGLNERGRKVAVPLLWNSILVGAQPRKGKTYSARALALYGALDPYVRIIVADGKASPDWRMFGLVADALILGTMPTRDGDPVAQLISVLRALKRDIQSRNERLSALPTSICPDGKLTREIARDPRYGVPVTLLVIDEFQAYYELDDEQSSKEIAGLLAFILSVGPSVGVIVLSSTQKPSGIGGTGQVGKLFMRYRDNHGGRFALKCGSRDVSQAVLGTEAYGEGVDASSLPVTAIAEDGSVDGPDYRGIGYLYGLTDHTPCVRTYLADAADAEHICKAARALRERAGTLSGMAAGQSIDCDDPADILRDARSAVPASVRNVSWPRLAAALRDMYPARYADATAESVSAQMRAAGVDGKTVVDNDHFPSGRGQGCAVTDIDAAMARRAGDG